MTARNPMKIYTGYSTFETMNSLLKRIEKKPRIGVTQGGSSRKYGGAKPAATTAKHRDIPWKQE